MRRYLALGLVSLLWSGAPVADPGASPRAAAERTAASLIARHVEWRGGERALARWRALGARGRLSAAGLEGTIALAARRDGFYRIEIDLQAFSLTRCVAGEEGWLLNTSGQVEPMGEREVLEARRELARSLGERLLDRPGSFSLLDAEVRDGRSWQVARLDYSDGDAWDLLIDAEDGRLEWTREIIDTAIVWHRYTDWREVDGIRLPFMEQAFHENPAQDQTIVWTAVEINPELEAIRFDRPRGRRVARIAEGSPSTGWMGLDTSRGQCICLPGELNGVPAKILLDSGAGITVLDRAVAARSGLEGAGSLTAKGVSGTAQAELVGEAWIRIGDLEVGPLTAAVVDLASLSPNLEVILGKEVFHNVVVDVDYPGSRVRFHEPERFRYEGPGRSVQLVAGEDGHRRLALQIEGLPPAIVELDTGSNSALDVFRSYADEHGLLEDRPRVSEQLAAGVGGSSVFKTTTLEAVTIAGYELTAVPAGFPQAEAGAFHTKRIAGNLGTAILERFRVVFDYGRAALWLEPGADWGRPFARDRSGLQMRDTASALEVVFVAPGSPAAAAGWSVGERIVAVNGREIGNDDDEAPAGWNRAPAGTIVRLRTSEGEERALTLADYF